MKKVLVLVSFVAASFAVNAQNSAQPAVSSPTVTPASNAAQTPATPVATDNKNASEMQFAVLEFNFGTIKQGDVVNHDFDFNNVGKEPLIISEAHGSCGCTVPQWPKEPIKKGDKGTIKVTFNSAGKMGMQDKTVTITSNAKNSPVVLHLKGNVEKPAEAPAPAATPVAPVEKK